jgi:hypothetical protein
MLSMPNRRLWLGMLVALAVLVLRPDWSRLITPVPMPELP